MALNINTNIGALNAAAAASSVNKAQETAMERLSTGQRINTAADDAAGVAISSRLTSEIRGTNQAIRNAMDAQALIDTAEGAHSEIENILQRMRELSVQAANDTNSANDRANLQAEVDQLVSEIDRIANVSTWAGESLINKANTFNFQIGARGSSSNSANQISVTMNAMTGAALGVKAGNAAVGAQGATLKEVGENVLQVGGTPVVGDVYEFSINGEKVSIELTADADDNDNFDYKLTVGSGAATTVAATTVDQGKTAAGVADILAQAINGLSSNNPGLVATATANDGSVTITQTVTVTGGYDMAAAGEAAITKLTADTANVVLAGSTSTSTFLADKTFKIAGEGAWGDAKVTKFTINGTEEISVDGDALATAGYAKTSVGAANYIADQLNAKTDLKGLSFRVGSLNNDVYIEMTQTSATLIENETVTPKASTSSLLINTQADASAAIATIDKAITTVNAQRANLGAVSNRLDSTVANMTNIATNLEAGRSRIQDADFAAESTNLAKTQILQQASTAMLAQANASKQGVLSLLQG